MAKRRPITRDESLNLANIAHAAFLDALISESSWNCDQIAFHGGTSLHLSWKSPRYSEDLDFLISRDLTNLDKSVERARRKTEELISTIDPKFKVEIRDKTVDPNRMPVFHLVINHPEIIGSVMIKVEFWKVDAEYLKKYPTEFKTPSSRSDMVSKIMTPIPAASLETAYCDKLTAFATRPFLKWRDVYDLWWIGTQAQSDLDIDLVVKQFIHNVSAYNTLNDLPPADALRLFLKNDRADIVKKADPDLKRWLPDSLWKQLWPKGVEQMVDYVYASLEAVADAVDNKSVSKPNLNRAPK